jgi:hypothetical protein
LLGGRRASIFLGGSDPFQPSATFFGVFQPKILLFSFVFSKNN